MIIIKEITADMMPARLKAIEILPLVRAPSASPSSADELDKMEKRMAIIPEK